MNLYLQAENLVNYIKAFLSKKKKKKKKHEKNVAFTYMIHSRK